MLSAKHRPLLAQAERDGVAVIVRAEPGENRAMTQDRAWEIARSVQAFTDDRGEFDAAACEVACRRRVLERHLGCGFLVSETAHQRR